MEIIEIGKICDLSFQATMWQRYKIRKLNSAKVCIEVPQKDKTLTTKVSEEGENLR